MKKTIKLLGIIAFAAVIVLSMTAATCGNKSGGEDGGSSSGGKSEPSTLKITGLPKQKLLAVVVSEDKDLSSFVSAGIAALVFEAGGENNNGSGNVFELSEMFSGNSWTGTGKRQVILINNDYNKDDPTNKNNPAFRTAAVNFTNGGATVKFSSFKAVTKKI